MLRFGLLLASVLVLTLAQEEAPPVYIYEDQETGEDGSAIATTESPCAREIRKKVQFLSLQLQAYSGCINVTRDDCLYLHEAVDNCPCVCAYVVQESIPLLEDLPIQPDFEFSQLAEESAVCFSADQEVETNAGRMTMGELLHADTTNLKIQAWDHELHQPVMSPMQYWLHADASRLTEYIRLTTFDDKHITLTPGHVIVRSETCAARDVESVMAERVSRGDCLLLSDGRLTKISTIERVQRVGIYAPMTKIGSIVVNDLVASCYAYEDNQHILQILTWVHHTVRDLMGITANTLPGDNVQVPYFMGALNVLKPYFHALY